MGRRKKNESCWTANNGKNTGRGMKDNAHRAKFRKSGNADEKHKMESGRGNGLGTTENHAQTLFPSWTPWVVSCVTLVFRVLYVIDPSNWWVLHPDEIFQSMDVAHSEVYGFGFRPYEFNSPAKEENVSHYTARESTLGMNALRSPIFPQLLALVAVFASWLNIGRNPYLLWRVSHVFISSSLPLAVYKYAKNSFNSHDIASTSAILVATSFHLNVFGTHTVVNSFTSSFLFWSLSQTVALLKKGSDSCYDKDDKEMKSDLERSFKRQENRTDSDANFQPVFGEENSFTVLCTTSCTDEYKSLQKQESEQSISGSSIDYNERDESCTQVVKRKRSSDSGYGSVSSRSGISDHANSRDDDKDIKNNSENSSSSSRSSSSRSSSSSSSSSRSSSSSSGINTNSTSGCGGCKTALLDEAKCHNETVRWLKQNSSSSKPEFIQPPVNNVINDFIILCAGATLALSLYIRPDSAMMTSLLLLSHLKDLKVWRLLLMRQIRVLTLGGFIGVLIACADDVYFYDCLVLSPVQWTKFNVFTSMPGKLFGNSSTSFYLKTVYFANYGMAVSTIALSLFVIHLTISKFFSFFILSKKILIKNNERRNKFAIDADDNSLLSLLHVLCFLFVTIAYSFVGHKEERFLHNAIVIFFVSLSGLVYKHIYKSSRLTTKSKQMLLFVFLSLFAGSQWHSVPNKNKSDVNKSLYFISNQKDVKGVFSESDFKISGSYSLLHHNVPFISMVGDEFLEFDPLISYEMNRKCFLGQPSCNVTFTSLNTVSDLIHVNNGDYLIKRLANTKHYNYAIIPSVKKFFHPAFVAVFHAGNHTVWRRSYRRETEHQLKIIADKIPEGGWNVTVQEYEAESLKLLGNFDMALNRFQAVLKHGVDKVEVYASMIFCLYRSGRTVEARRLIKFCYQKYDKNACRSGNSVRHLSLD